MKKICSLIFALILVFCSFATSYAVSSPNAPIYIDTDVSGRKCPICHKPIDGDDDYIVCDGCHEVYHKECYISNNGCLFEDEHGKVPSDTDSGNVKDPNSPTTGAYPPELLFGFVAVLAIGGIYISERVLKRFNT